MPHDRVWAAPGAGAKRYVAPSIAHSEGVTQDPAERIRLAEAEARGKGYEAGYAEGRRNASAEADARLAGLVESVGTLSTLRSNLMRAAERDLLRLAVLIAGVVVRDRIASDNEVVVRAVRDALSELPKSESFTIRCHPADEESLRKALGVAAGTGGGVAGVTIRPDPAVSPGGCYVESVAGELDVTVETQLRLLEHELLERS